MWNAAVKLRLDPDVVLEWRESKLALWTVVADGHQRQELLAEMVALSHAVWNPKALSALLGERRAPMTKDEVRAALERAERVGEMRMRTVALDKLPT